MRPLDCQEVLGLARARLWAVVRQRPRKVCSAMERCRPARAAMDQLRLREGPGSLSQTRERWAISVEAIQGAAEAQGGEAVVEEAGDLGGVADGEGELVIGVGLAEFAEGFGDEVLTGGGRGADAEGAELGAGGAFDVGDSFIEGDEEAAGVA